MYEQQKPFSISDYIAMSSFLNTFAYKVCIPSLPVFWLIINSLLVTYCWISCCNTQCFRNKMTLWYGLKDCCNGWYLLFFRLSTMVSLMYAVSKIAHCLCLCTHYWCCYTRGTPVATMSLMPTGWSKKYGCLHLQQTLSVAREQHRYVFFSIIVASIHHLWYTLC